MKVITSKENRIFQGLEKLSMKKYRDREGVFLAEGPNIIREAESQEEIEVVEVFAREGSGYETFSESTTVLAEDLFDRISDQVSSQGLVAVIRKPDRGDKKEALGLAASKGGFIVLDRLQDPGNIGTIIRTAEGAGMSAIAIIKGTCDPFSPKVVRACAGSVLRMPLIFFDSAEEFLQAAEDEGVTVAVTDVEKGVPYYSAGLSGGRKTALVIGNEGRGVSEVFKEAAGILVNIPMKGKLESLNAGVAAAILMYEMGRPE